MNQLSKTEQVLKEMRQYLIDILVLSEIRWTGNGLEKFSDGYVMAFSGHPSVHRTGVGLLMSPLAQKAMTNWNPVNEHIMTARFVSNHTKMTIIACYAPTNEADEEEKDALYKMLHSVTKDVPRHDVLCVVGDLNAKVGADRQYCPEVLGPHGMGEINENGTQLIDYALSNGLIIGGSMFDHKTIHKYTWAKLETRALKAKRPGFSDERYNETDYYFENAEKMAGKKINHTEIIAKNTVSSVVDSGKIDKTVDTIP
ncbi:hypothetical protein QYM36_002297 [Artemia franciscana]|uniref:Endonuclease/exonuclease/phosphatase domain-containing protein n=1 Tax=Artemia franciscana TaxID=6661 RepID=A0AA88I9H3_ARTSF|nr:hypothetical protein QYM36_002297 [Artemia franciscana]